MTADTTTLLPKRKSRKKAVAICLIVLLCLGAAGYGGYKLTLQPAEGTIVTEFPDAKPAVKAPELVQFDGKYISFVRPDSYTEQPPRKDDPNSLETHTFIASGIMSKVLTVVVAPLASGQLTDDASYSSRSQRPDTYQMKPQVIKGEKVIVAVNTKEHQETAFWVHKAKLLSLSLNGLSVESDATGQEYQKILESVTWR